ncbi:MAG: TolC family protein [Nitrospirae bacterium]|nr:TolC family protein [Nitrospirota bacterium]
MRMSRKWIWIIAVLLLGLYTEAFAEGKVISLHDALQQALKGNPEIRANEHALFAVKEDIRIARSFLLPRIGFEERFMRTNNPTYAFMAKLNQERFAMTDFAIPSLNNPQPVSDFQSSVSFEQAVFAPKAYIGLKMSRKEFEAKGQDVERNKDEVVFSVFKTYLDSQTARAYVSVAEKGIEDAKEHLRISESRNNAGLGLYSDMLRAQVALRTAEERKVSAEKNMKVAGRALGLMLGLTSSINVTDQRPSLELKDLAYYENMALTRKDLKALEARHTNAENNLKMADASYLPTIGIGGSYQLNSHRAVLGEEGQSWQVMAFLRWEIFDGLRREAERSKAKHKLAEAGEYLDGMKKRISFAIYEAYLSVEEARKGLELAKANLASAEEGRRLVTVRYENNLAAAVDMLDVQSSLDAVRADVVAKEASYLTAIARLSYESGTIMKDLDIER